MSRSRDEAARRLDLIRKRVERGAYVVSFTHTEKLRRRRIGAQDIEEAIRNGAIIEDYADDPRGPSCLILGRSGERPIHVVCGLLNEEQILIITAYQPDPSIRFATQESPRGVGGRLDDAKEVIAMLTKCYFCQGKVEASKVDVDFRWGRKLKVIRGVPAGVCRQCGERYFDAAVYKSMEKLGASRKKAAERLEVEVLPFRAAS